jgi:uncharacterized protein YdhG (YjbR/CyaY superfamily)
MKNSPTTKRTFTNIDEYIADFPKDIQVILEQVRATIHKAAPDAKETISYQMPAFALEGILVYFAAFKNHIGFFPTASGVAHFEKELMKYKTSKGTIQFPLDRPIPFDLIRQIVVFRVKENLAKAKRKKGKS